MKFIEIKNNFLVLSRLKTKKKEVTVDEAESQ